MKPYTDKEKAVKQTHSPAQSCVIASLRTHMHTTTTHMRSRCKLIGRYSRGTAVTVASHLYR